MEALRVAGQIDGADGEHLTTALWQDGDFNYDGIINDQDYLLIDRVFIQQGAQLSPEFLSSRQGQFGEAYVSALLTSLPEPSSFCVVSVIFVIFCRRRLVRIN